MQRRPSQSTSAFDGARTARVLESRRGFRELPGASVRVRGQNDLSYNPGKPLRLPQDRQPRRPPQLNLGAIVRLLLPIVVLAGLGIGVFFGVDALLDDGGATPAAVADAADPAGDTAADVADGDPAPPGDASADASTADAGGTTEPPDATGDAATDSAVESLVPTTPRIITPADLGGAPVIQERGAARPVPDGSTPSLEEGTYDPTNPDVAFSSVWSVGTIVEVTRLPGAPLLSEEEAAQFVGKTIRLTIVSSGTFPEELQLTPAAYQLLAQDREPIIAVRIEAVGAPE